jgi:TRAP-type C4-dicarboxylate transport system permease small subunit
LVGLSMVAGWLSAFRNRAYLGLLGLAFLMLSGSLLAADRASAMQALGGPADPKMALAATVLLAGCVVSFAAALLAALRETARRVREVRERHEAAEQAMLEMIRASQEREQQERPAEDGGTQTGGEDDG